ncbi:MAG: MGMT family protein, partial [Clostridiaceae bacterium]|nr:MGMT family protein [Clostridiaceae bacterium]
KILLEIPYGQTMSYGEIAGLMAQKRGLDRMSARAVGGAVGHNPISIVIPCHRVIGADGSLTGFGGGLPRKTWLLQHEGVFSGRPHELNSI